MKTYIQCIVYFKTERHGGWGGKLVCLKSEKFPSLVVHPWCLPLFSSLNPFCHLEPHLVGIFTGWSISFTVNRLIRSTQNKQEFQRCRKGCVPIYRYTLFIVHLFLMIIFWCIHEENSFQKHVWRYYVTTVKPVLCDLPREEWNMVT